MNTYRPDAKHFRDAERILANEHMFGKSLIELAERFREKWGTKP